MKEVSVFEEDKAYKLLDLLSFGLFSLLGLLLGGK